MNLVTYQLRQFSLIFLTVLGSFSLFGQTQQRSVSIDKTTDDATESLATGNINLYDSHLPIEDGVRGSNVMGFRFREVQLPAGASITSARVIVRAAYVAADDVQFELAFARPGYNNEFSANTGNLSARQKGSTTTWTIPGNSQGELLSPDLSAALQALVSGSTYDSSEALTLLIEGEGQGIIEAFEKGANHAAQLTITYGVADPNGGGTNGGGGTTTGGNGGTTSTVEYTKEFSIRQSDDDGELNLVSGYLNLNSSDLELCKDGDEQMVGLRFDQVDIPVDAEIEEAYLQFTTDESKAGGDVNLAIQIENTGDALELNLQNLKSRAYADPVFWRQLEDWTVYNSATSAQQSPSLATPLQAILDRGDWASGQAILIAILPASEVDNSFRQNSSKRVAQSYNKSSTRAPKLVVRYRASSDGTTTTNPPTTTDCADVHFSCFEGLGPSGQLKRMVLPETHTFERLFELGDAYMSGGGYVLDKHDFAAYVGRNANTNSEHGYLSVNHEDNPGGVSILDIRFDGSTKKWEVDNTHAVDFSGSGTARTAKNCSGGITPWGTVITCEETTDGGDWNGDGYEDLGWLTEIDPVEGKVIKNKFGKREKMWGIGRAAHENAVIMPDERTIYTGEDGGSSAIFKFVADNPRDFSSGKLYALKMDVDMSNYEPRSSTGEWISIPNDTQEERNRAKNNAIILGATNFQGVEDIEVHPVTGQFYFASKHAGRIYRFTETGNKIEDFEVFIGGRSYPVATAGGTAWEPWGLGNDNLTFDDRGNLFVLQDGDLSYIWLVGPTHSQANPDVKIFATMPEGSEPTGLTFSPDFRFGFLSIQHPSGANRDQDDAFGNPVALRKSCTVVIARKEHLGNVGRRPLEMRLVQQEYLSNMVLSPNPTNGPLQLHLPEGLYGDISVIAYDENGRRAKVLTDEPSSAFAKTYELDVRDIQPNSGLLLLHIEIGGEGTWRKVFVK